MYFVLDKEDLNLDFDILFSFFWMKIARVMRVKRQKDNQPEGPLNFTYLCINLTAPLIHESFIFWFNFKKKISVQDYPTANDNS